jgi:hypothetical protein
MWREFSFLLALLFLVTSCNRNDSIPKAASTMPITEDVQIVVKILEQMPDWTTFSLNKTHARERAAIEEGVRRVANYDLDTIRTAMAIYDTADAPGAMGKLFVLNRYLFNLPEEVPTRSPHSQAFGGGWLGQPAKEDAVSLRWPWSIDAEGTWRLTGQFGGFMGPPYDALGAFDYYRKHFGKRPGAGG